MAPDNVEVVRRIYAEWERGNLGAGVEQYDLHCTCASRGGVRAARFP